jgi:hypothetical protein
MATKSKATFQKRQKEMKRQEKQRMKVERRAQKKLLDKDKVGSGPPIEALEIEDFGERDMPDEIVG